MAETKECTSERKSSTWDYLSVTFNPDVKKILLKHAILSHGNTAIETEDVIFSDYVVKINPRDKPQERVLVITNKAMYNLLPSDYSTCKRRIPLSIISNITVSQTSNEFVLHVPSEYDYRIMSLRKDEIVQSVKKFSKELQVEYTQQSILKSLCITKQNARIIKRNLSKLHDSSMNILTSESKLNEKSDDIPVVPASTIKREDVTGWAQDYTDVSPSDFHLLKVLGRGSFGKVMLVKKSKDDSSNKMYAMKILRKEIIIQRNQVEHTKAEREILEHIDHPFLMKMYYAFQTQAKLYLVMDYLTGGELFFHLKKSRRFSEPRARLYTAEIALGLGHLHSHNIIYRDLKPENILLDSEGHIRLTDFGLSKKSEIGTQAQTFCGTPEYLAPEIVIGNGHGKDVDWWSMGIFLYEMIVGIPPFYSENVDKMYELISNAELNIPPLVSDAAKDLIYGLLERDPQQRTGYGLADVEDIMKARWFEGLDWDMVFNKSYKPEFIPAVAHSADTSNFDTEFTSEPVIDSFVPESAIGEAIDEASFTGFTYRETSAIAPRRVNFLV